MIATIDYTPHEIVLPDTQYGGYVDWSRGKYVQTHKLVHVDSCWTSAAFGAYQWFGFAPDNTSRQSVVVSNILATQSVYGYTVGITVANNDNRLYFCNGVSSTQAEANQWLIDNPLYAVLMLATPIEYDITLPTITALAGVNNLYHDGNGNTEVTYNADALHLIQQLQNAVVALGGSI